MKTASMALTAALLFGCTPVTRHTRPLSEQAVREIAEEVAGRDVAVSFGPLSADRFRGRALKVGPESTSWEYRDEQKAIRQMQVPTEAIRDIVVIKRGAGAGIGFLIGASAGALGGYLVGLGQWCSGCGSQATGPAVLGGLVGGLIGGIVGVSAGYPTRIDFADAPPPPGVRESTPVR